MLRCHLAVLMAQKKLKVADVCRETGLNRTAVSALYYERMQRIEVETIERLCALFNCGVADLLEVQGDENPAEAEK